MVTIVHHTRHGLCFITEASNPSQAWINHQKITPKKNAEWFSAFPMSGGEVCIDIKNEITSTRNATTQDLEEAILISSKEFNPAIASIKALMKQK